MKMLRKNYEADWERKKRYLIRTMFEEPPALSPIRESDEPKSRGPSTSADVATELPELIIERVPKRRNGESAHFYNHLRKRMRKYYRKIFNLRTDDSSGTEFDEEIYDEYNPEYTIVTHQDDLNVSYVIEQLDRESDLRDKSTLYLGSLSSRKDSSEKERVNVSKSSGSEKRRIDHPGSKDVECVALMESFVRADKGKINTDDSQDIDLRFSEESNMIRHSGHLDYPNVERMIEARKDSNDEIILPETDVDIIEERSNKLSNLDLETEKSVVKYLQTKVDNSRRRMSDGDSTNILHTTEDGERETEKYDQSEDSVGKRREEDSHVEEKSADDEMETEEESDQLGENQEECDEEEESSKEGCERNDSKSDQMSKSQDNEEEESEPAEEDSDQSPQELEIMRSYKPAPSIDSLRHEAASDIEENTSLNRFTHRHSLPQNEVESPAAAVPETQATDDDEFNFLLRTSTPKKSKETRTKRPSDFFHEQETTAKKKYFRNIRLQTDEIEKQVSCMNVALQTDCIHVRHFGIQAEEKPVVNENVGTQTDMLLGDYRDIGIQVALQKKLRSIEVQTDINLSEFTNIEIQTDRVEVERKDAEIQADLRQEGVIDVGVQTDERRGEDRSYEFFERRGIFFFFF